MSEQNTEIVTKKNTTITEMLVSRQAQEVQASMAIAKRFPRDENESYKKIMRSCARVGLAEQAEYTYPRGDKKIMGPSIRLAESIAQNWGNIDFGIIELESSNGKSEMMAYAWDLETNTRVTKVFIVEHKRDTRGGSYKLTDSRDIYEATANFGSRRLRACILGIIPGDIIESAVKECRKTIKGENKSPIEDRIKVMLNTFEKEHRVTTEQIEEYLGCNVKGMNENDLIKMRGVHQSITDGMSTAKDYFGRPEADKPNMPISDPFKKKDEIPTVLGAEDQEIKDKLRKTYPNEEDWQIDARFKDIKESGSKK